jgi:outer membrane scaffolding protein for murein synthesis (MipA/OmpV family)
LTLRLESPRRRGPLRTPFAVRAALVLSLSAASGASAQEGTGSAPLWEVGAGALASSQQAYPGSDERVGRAVALPYLIYRGQWLRADDQGIGVRPIRTPEIEFDVSAAAAFGSGGNEVQARRGMPRLGTLVEFGPRLRWHLGGTREAGRWRLDLPLRGVFDLSDSLAYRGVVWQPGLSWDQRSGPWRYGAGVSALVGNRHLANTFYGVAPAYATPTRPAFDAAAGLIAWRLSASVTRELGRDWRVFAYARVDSVAGARNRASPLVRETTGATVAVGLSYTWLRSQAPAGD